MISVLYVDDEKNPLILCKTSLEQNTDFDVDICTSAIKALEKIRTTSYDAIISGYDLPEMNGLEFLSEVRTSYGDIPFILLTGTGREENVIETLNCMADFYLQKGGESTLFFTHLSHIIRQAVEGRQAKEDLRKSITQLQHAEKIAGFGHWTLHLDTGKLSGSQGARDIYGMEGREWSLDEVQQLPFSEFRPILDEALKTLIEGGKPYHVEFKIKRKTDGQERDIYSVAEYDPATNRVFGIIQDITQRKSAERAVVQSEAKYRLLVENINDALFSIDTQGIITYISPAGERLFGYHSSDLVNLPFSEVVHPDDLPVLLHRFKNLKEGIVIPSEWRLVQKDGSHSWVRTSTRLVVDAEGNQSLFGVITDISKERKGVVALLESEKKYRSLVNYSLEGILIFNMQGTILFANMAAAHLVEIANHSGIPGRNVMEFIAPECQERAAQDLKEISRGNDAFLVEYEVITITGKRRWVASIGKLIQYEGQLSSLLSIRDITEQKQSEQMIREKSAYLENLIFNANVPIIVWDPQFRIIQINRAFELLIGRSETEVLGHSLAFLFPPDQADRSMRLIQTTLVGVRWETVEIDMVHLDGSIRTALWNSSTIYSQDGKSPIATIAQGQDITEERRLELEKDVALIQIQQNLAYLAILNDEIRNPLTVIITYADMLGDSRLTDQIMIQTQRIDEMVHQLDQRWMESEKVLNTIRKHYLIHTIPPSEQNIDPAGTRSEQKRQSDRKREILIEEVQAQLYTTLDCIDALVYVADMDTYDLLFLNRRGRSIFGDIIGQKCYLMFHKNQDRPCPYCTNLYLKDQSGSSEVYQWEYQNPLNGRWYDCRDQAIRWSDGRLVRLEISTDITTRKLDEETLRKNEHFFQGILNSTPNLIYLYDLVKHCNVYANKGVLDFLGYSPEQITTMGSTLFDTILNPDDGEQVISHHARMRTAKDEEVLECEYRMKHANGTWRLLQSRDMVYLRDKDGMACQILGSAEDITEHKQAEDNLRHVTRLYLMMSQLEQTIVRTREQNDLFNRICEVAIEFGQFRMAWVGLVDGTGDRIQPIAHAGYEEGYLDQISITIGDPLTGNGPTGSAFSDGEIKTSDDIATEGMMLPWREEALKRGYRSSAAVPLRCRGTIIGVFSLYATQTGFFTADEQKLLQKIGEDISFGLDMMALETERLRAEASLRESEERFRKIFTNSPIGMTLVTPDFRFFSVNPAWVFMTGYSKEELLTMSFMDITHPDHRSGDLEHIQELVAGTIPEYSTKKRYVRKDGSILWGWIKVTAILDQQGTFQYFAAQIEDITEHKEAELALKNHTALLSILNSIISTANKADNLQKLLKSILEESLRLLDFDAGGIYLVDYSTRTADIVYSIHLPPEFVAEIRSVPIDKKPYDTLFIQNTPIFSENYTLISAENARISGFQSMASIPLLSKDIAIGALNMASTKRYTISEEEKQTLSSISRELGSSIERMVAEEKGRKASKNVETLFNSIDEMIMVLDLQGHILAINDAVLNTLSYVSEELIGKNIHQLFGPEKSEEVHQVIQGILAGTLNSCSMPILAKDGTRISVETKVTRGEWHNQEVLIGVSRDISERMRAEEALHEANQKLRLLSGITRHDILNTLNAVQILQNLALSTSDPDKIQKYISEAQEAGNQIEETIGFTREYESFGLVSSGWQQIYLMIGSAKGEVSLGTITVMNQISVDLEVYADPIIRKVFTTIMENSVRHGGDLTNIRFFSSEREDTLIITCEDDGVGIPSDEKERIFDHGFGKHTGIGLFLAREILSITGLSIRECGEEGNGARFEILVPEGKFRYHTNTGE